MRRVVYKCVLPAGFALAGFIIGFAAAACLDAAAFARFADRLGGYAFAVPENAAWAEAFGKHMRAAILVWLLGFSRLAPQAAYAVCAGKAAALGFVLALFGRVYGAVGVLYGLQYAGLQQMILLLALVALAAACRMYAEGKLRLLWYGTALGVYAMAAAFVAAVEAAGLPGLFL